MGLRETDYVVLSEGRPIKKAGESWLEILKRWLVECPRCTQVWLVVGAQENDHYVCKDCGHGFAIRFPITPSDSALRSIVVARERQ